MKRVFLYLMCAAVIGVSFVGAKPQHQGHGFVGRGNNKLRIKFSTQFAFAKQNIPYGQSLFAVGGTPPYTFSSSGASLPAGLTLMSTGPVTGTPTGSGASAPTWTVTDARGATSSQQNAINVATISSVAVTVTNGASPTVAIGSTLQIDALSTWSDGSTLDVTNGNSTWASADGTKATVNSTGLVTGVAATSPTVAISDTVNGTPGSIAITVPGAPPPNNPAVITTSLPSGQVQLPYPEGSGSCATLQASGGTLPYTWSITVGTLPTGLTLNATTGQICGTATAAGTALTFQVRDVNGNTATNASPITIAIATLSSIAGTLAQSSIVAGAQTQFTYKGTYSDSTTAVPPLANGASRVNQFRGASAGTSPTASVASNAFIATAGNFIWLLVESGDAGTAPPTMAPCTDTAGNTFHVINTPIGGPVTTPPFYNSGVLQYAWNILANATDVVTCTYSPSTAFVNIYGEQWQQMQNSSDPLDAHPTYIQALSQNGGTSSPFTTTAANELAAFVTLANSISTGSAGSGFSLSDQTGIWVIEDQHLTGTVSGAVATSVFSPASNENSLLATFKASGSTGVVLSSSNTPCANVTQGGNVTGASVNAVCTANITATDGAVSGFATITVNPQSTNVDTAIVINPLTASATVGGTIKFTTTGNVNKTTSYTSSSVFVSSTPSIFSFSVNTGTCNAAGNVTVTASANNGALPDTQSASVTCSAPSAGALLTGCVVGASNIPTCATPAGFTLVDAQGFETGSLNSGESLLNTAITNQGAAGCSGAHTGGNSAAGTVASGASQTGFITPSTSFSTIVVSWWECDDTNVSFNDEMYAARLFTSAGQGLLIEWGTCDVSIAANCGSGFNVKQTRFTEFLEFCAGGAPANGCRNNGSGGETVRSPNPGTWTQYEEHFTPSTGNTSNGAFALYQNGVVMTQQSNVNLNGTFVMSPAQFQVGGVYTKILWSNSTSSLACSTSVYNGGAHEYTTPAGATEYVTNFAANSSADGSNCLSAGQGPTPTFTRRFDDVIVIKQ